MYWGLCEHEGMKKTCLFVVMIKRLVFFSFEKRAIRSAAFGSLKSG